ncbi:Family 2 glycosyl transferase [Candidatus Zixiibacteriota bacterium]|nr:Family 2 glycosyl transferase [candidate division Zixibacteria bacterium]
MKVIAGKVSVVIVTYNGAEFIRDCLRSLMDEATALNLEIVAVDNGSTDGTAALISKEFPIVKLIKNNVNAGFARAANQGIEMTQGDIILLLNQDTKIRNDAVSKLARFLNEKASAGVIGPRFNGFDGILQKSCRALPRYRDLLFEFTGLSYLFPRSKIFAHWKMGWFDHLTEREVDQPMGAAMMFRKGLFERLGGFDEDFPIFFNDVDFCRRAQDAGLVNYYYPEAVIEHFVGGSTRKRKPQMILESHRAMYRYFRKYCRKSFLSRIALYFWGIMLYISAYLRVGLSLIFK